MSTGGFDKRDVSPGISIQYHGYPDIFDAFHTEGPFSQKKPQRRLSGILATHTFKSSNQAVDSIPRTGWVAENTIRVNTTSNGSLIMELKPIR